MTAYREPTDMELKAQIKEAWRKSPESYKTYTTFAELTAAMTRVAEQAGLLPEKPSLDIEN